MSPELRCHRKKLRRSRRFPRRGTGSVRRRLGLESLEEKRLLAVFTVDSTADLVDLNPGNGVCEVAVGGVCTVRAAIQEANALGTAEQPDLIVIPSGNYTLVLAGNGNLAGDLDITQSVRLLGAGAANTVIDGNGIDRVLDVQGGNVEIQGVTIRGGVVEDTEALLDGTGGGVRNEGTLLIADSVVTGNRATQGAGVGNYNGTLNIQRSVITGNGDSATQRGGGIANYSYYDPAHLLISDSTVSGNRASTGGGINNHGYDGLASAVITGSTISGNNADAGGGIGNRAVYYAEQGANAALTIQGSTLSGNVASATGGGIHNQASADSDASLNIGTSTITNNTATGGVGGGIHVADSTGTSAILSSVILAGNIAVGSGQDLASTLVTASYTIVGSSSGHALADGVNHNQIGVDPLLDPLADNGGLTLTHGLSVASPAIDQGVNASGLYSDQRGSGFLRIVDDGGIADAGDGTDVGAIEVGQTGALYDFGDAPESIVVDGIARNYPSRLASDGARHQVVVGGPSLGAVAPDPEADSFPAANATGDDLVGFDDEDGLNASTTVLTPGALISGISLEHDGGGGGAFLNVWIDLNLDGDWNDPGDQVMTDIAVPAGISATSLESVLIPAATPMGTTFLRARISSVPGLSPQGSAIDGEVEDVALSVGAPVSESADLSVSNGVNNSEPTLNEQVSFAISVTNAGPSMATGIEVSALLPFDLFFDSAQLTQGIYDDFDGLWLVGSLMPGQSADMVLNAVVETTDPVSLTVEVVAGDQLDPDSTPGNGVSGEDDQATAALGTCLSGGPIHLGMNRLTYSCASPGAFTSFVRGKERGSTTFPEYQAVVDIANAEQMAVSIADSNGIAEVLFYVDSESLGDSMLVQAFEMFPGSHKTNTLALGDVAQFLSASTMGPGAAPLHSEILQPSIVQALTAWHAAGADRAEVRDLGSVLVTISDLPGDAIARTVGRTLVLDVDAAGNGWFVDATPWEASEFGGNQQSGFATGGVAFERIDLLTTLVHEFGHLLGMPHTHDIGNVMHHTLGAGRRLLPTLAEQPDPHLDVSQDGRVSVLDALMVMNHVARQMREETGDLRFWRGRTSVDWFAFDANNDGSVTTIDALTIVNRIASQQRSDAESEFEPIGQPDESQATWAEATEIIFTSIGEAGLYPLAELPHLASREDQPEGWIVADPARERHQRTFNPAEKDPSWEAAHGMAVAEVANQGHQVGHNLAQGRSDSIGLLAQACLLTDHAP